MLPDGTFPAAADRPVMAAMRSQADRQRADRSARYFRSAPGEYGEGDRFFGIRVPQIRQLARQYPELPMSVLRGLLRSAYHEARLLTLIILVEQFNRATAQTKRQLFDFYMDNLCYVNHWDLVDTSAPVIIGGYLENRSRKILYRLARSSRLWDRRIAILATFHFIRENDFEDALQSCRLLLNDKEDLVQKAVGWMLREIGKRDCVVEERFLQQHYREMPRTMLRYAIEKFPDTLRERYLKGKLNT